MIKPDLEKHFDRIPETLGCAGCWFFDSDNIEYCSAIIPDCKGVIYMPKTERILSMMAAIDRHIVYVGRRMRLGKRFNAQKKSMKTYDIIELSKLSRPELDEVAREFELDPDTYYGHRQELMYAILDVQTAKLNSHA